jgi:hypothetical protein
MTDDELEEIARQWIAYQWVWEEHGGACPECDALQWVYVLVSGLPVTNSEDAWELVLTIRRLDESECIRQILAASLFEDLMETSGSELIDRVEEEVHRNPKFLDVINGIYHSRISDEVWSRLSRLTALKH